MDHVAQTHRIGEPAHRLLHIATALHIACMLLMGLGQQGQPAGSEGLHHREIELIRLALGDPLALLLHQQPQPQIVEIGSSGEVVIITLPITSLSLGKAGIEPGDNPLANLNSNCSGGQTSC
jgi:hypothetical protein